MPVKDDWMPVQIVSLENSGIMYSVLVPKGKMKGVVLGHSNVFRWMNVEPAAGFAYISSTATLDSFKDVMDDVLAKNILNLSGDVSFCSFVGSNDVYTGVQSVTEFMRLQIELVACLHRIPGCNAMITLAEYPYPPESEDIKHVHIFRQDYFIFPKSWICILYILWKYLFKMVKGMNFLKFCFHKEIFGKTI